MLYEVITLRGEGRAPAGRRLPGRARARLGEGRGRQARRAGLRLARAAGVITSYSIHYTKLYEVCVTITASTFSISSILKGKATVGQFK